MRHFSHSFGVAETSWKRQDVLITFTVFTVFLFVVSFWQLDIDEYRISFASDRVRKEQQRVPHREFSKPNVPSYCNIFHEDRVAVAVRTDADEALDKLPAQLMTSLRCVREPLFFSDLDQTIGPYFIHDVIARHSSHLMDNNPDFDLYRLRKQLVAENRENELYSLVERYRSDYDRNVSDRTVAGDVDKYKFLHMVELAWELQPNRDWYVFLEAGTYLSVANLHRSLANLDSTQKMYLGRSRLMPNSQPPLWFADSRSGIILSGSAIREFCEENPHVASRMDSYIQQSSYGEHVLAGALDERLDLQVTNSAPRMNSDSQSMIPFSDHNWCERVVTMHHLEAQGLFDMYSAEDTDTYEEFFYRDVFPKAYSAGLPSGRRENWNNADFLNFTIQPPTNNLKPFGVRPEQILALREPNKSFEACELACIQNPKCLQFTFTTSSAFNDTTGEMEYQSQCFLSSVIRLGIEQPPLSVGDVDVLGEKTWTSGWLTDKIEKWVGQRQECVEVATALP